MLVVPCLLALGLGVTAEELDETWTVKVGNQAVQVNPDGSFRIPNIFAPDLFGPGGPGTGADGISDETVHLTGSRVVDGCVNWMLGAIPPSEILLGNM